MHIDDIIVYGRSFGDHLKNLAITLGRIEEANFKISPSKCKLFQNSIRFLGHVFSKDGIQTNPSKIAAVNSYPVPKTVKQVRAVLGLTEFYRKFIPSFGEIAQPLYNLLNKEKRFHWTEGCDKAFQSLKNTLQNNPISGFPTETDTFVLCTDASLSGIGAVLSQNQGGFLKVIAYASKTLQKGQRNYSATKRELYAVVYYTHYFREYLIGRKFDVITDHRALVWLCSFKEPDGLVARWKEKLSLFDFEIKHRPGTQISHADVLSRANDNSYKISAVNLESSKKAEVPFAKTQTDDYTLGMVRNWLISQNRPQGQNSLESQQT